MQVERIEFVLNGLDCAHCAAKIEEGIQTIPEVIHSNLNFVLKTLTIDIQHTADRKEIVNKIQQIVHRHEPHIVLLDKSESPIRNRVDRHSDIDAEQDENTDTIADAFNGMDMKPNRYKAAFLNRMEHRSFKQIAFFAVGIVLFVVALSLRLDFWMELSLFLVSYFFIGGEVLGKAIRNMTRGQVFDENFLMVIATLGAFAIREFPEAVAVMLFYQVGEFFQDGAVNRSRKSISDLMDIRPDYANLVEGEKERRVSPEEIRKGHTIRI